MRMNMNVSRPSSFRAALMVAIGAATVSGSASSSSMELFDKPVCYGLKLKMLRLFPKKPIKQEPVLIRVFENTNSEFPHENASFSDSEAKLTKLNESVKERPRLSSLAELAAVKMPVYAPTKNDLEIFRQFDRKQIIDEMQLGECMPMETRFNDLALTDLSQGDLISFEIDSKRELYWYRTMANVGVVLKYEDVEVKGFDENHDGTKWVTLGEKSKQSPIGISLSKDVWFSFKAATELGRLWPEKMNQEGLYEQYAKQLFAPKEFLEGRTLRLPLNILSKLHKKEGSIYKSLTLSY